MTAEVHIALVFAEHGTWGTEAVTATATGVEKSLFGDTVAQNRGGGVQVGQNNPRASVHHMKQILCDFEPYSPFCGRFSVQ